jgi:hypothetical protein
MTEGLASAAGRDAVSDAAAILLSRGAMCVESVLLWPGDDAGSAGRNVVT